MKYQAENAVSSYFYYMWNTYERVFMADYQ